MKRSTALLGFVMLLASACGKFNDQEQHGGITDPIVGRWVSQCVLSLKSTYEFYSDGRMMMQLSTYNDFSCSGSPRSAMSFNGTYSIANKQVDGTQDLDMHLVISGQNSDSYTVFKVDQDRFYTAVAKSSPAQRPTAVDPNNYMTRQN